MISGTRRVLVKPREHRGRDERVSPLGGRRKLPGRGIILFLFTARQVY